MNNTISIFFLLLFMIPLLSFAQSSSNGSRMNDSTELLRIYEAFNGRDHWPDSAKWDTTQPINTWPGIFLNEDGRVECIDLDSRSDCQVINQTDCGTTGTFIGYHSGGSIPDRLNLPTLKSLIISHLGLEGSIPDLSLLVNLEQLNMHCNKLSGSIPDFDLPKLERLNISRNELTGYIPTFSKVPQLRRMSLRINQLNGPIPDFQSTPLLTEIVLDGNKLEGVVPDYSAFELTTLSVYQNRLTFEHILPSFNTLQTRLGPSYDYQPQCPIVLDSIIYAPLGFPFCIGKIIDPNTFSNKFNWFKNSIPFPASNSGEHCFTEIKQEDTGIYNFSITNEEIPDLTLNTTFAIVRVCEPGIRIIDTLLCPESNLTLEQTIYDRPVKDTIQKLSIEAANGCDSMVQLSLRFYEQAIAGMDAETCADSFFLTATELKDATGTWLFDPAIRVQDDSSPQSWVNGLQPGPNRFIWEASAPECREYDRDTISIYYQKRPETSDDFITAFIDQTIQLNLLANDPFIPADVSFELINRPAVGLLTSNNNGTIDFEPPRGFFGQLSFEYKLCNTVCNNCEDATVTLNFIPNIDAPLVITPNGDATNEVLIIKELLEQKDQNNRITIINQWGQTVFQSSPYKNNWNGVNQNDQPLPEATYYYWLQFDKQEDRIGRVLLLR